MVDSKRQQLLIQVLPCSHASLAWSCRSYVQGHFGRPVRDQESKLLQEVDINDKITENVVRKTFFGTNSMKQHVEQILFFGIRILKEKKTNKTLSIFD